MTLRELPNLVQGSEEWFAARLGLVTASTVGNLITTRKLGALDFPCPECGAEALMPCRGKRDPNVAIKTLHPQRSTESKRQSHTIIEPASNDTSRDLTALLAAERINGWADPTFTTNAMWRGIEDEPRARDLYSQHYAPVREVGFMTEDRWGFTIGYSPDGLVGDDGAIEVKSRTPKTQVKTVLSQGVPIENMPQLQAGLLVSGREWIDYVSYAGGMALYVKRVYPDQRWFTAIVAAVQKFEQNAAEIIRIYKESTLNAPVAERVLEPELVI